jgi:large subunit ribosomal protein L17
MRHRVAHRKLGRVTEHRIAMLRNQSVALLRYETIETTVAKAKELRPFIERIISVAKRSLTAPEGSTHHVIARRTVARDIADRDVVVKLFETIAPRYADRTGGYTRLLRLGFRRGDSAELAQVELLGSEFNPNAEADKAKADAVSKPKKKTMGTRMREAFGGRKKDDNDGPGAKNKPSKPARGAGKKVTTPRKAGGS